MLTLALAAIPAISGAQQWPAKPIRFIMPVVAGGSADASARVLAERLAAKWKQPVVVENRPGAGTIIGTDAVAKAQPDGYTFGWVISAHAINPSLYAKLPYDTTKDLAGVTLVYQLKPAIVAAPSLPVSTVDDVVRLIKAKPGQLTYASPGTGSGVHLVAELFKLKHGLDIQHVAYKGGNAAHPDVMSGRVPLMFHPLPGALPFIEARKLKLVAVVSDAPIPGHPEFPLLTGLLPKDAVVGWNGIVVPARTPREIVAKLNADLVAVIRSPEVQERFAALTVQTITSTPEKFDAFIREVSAAAAEPQEDQVGLHHVALQVENFAALQEGYKDLKQRGIRILRAVDHGTTNSIYFCDPAGNRLELYCDVGTDGLDRARRRTARSPRDFPTLSLES